MPKKTRFDKLLDTVKDHRVFVPILVIGFGIILLGNLTDALDKIWAHLPRIVGVSTKVSPKPSFSAAATPPRNAPAQEHCVNVLIEPIRKMLPVSVYSQVTVDFDIFSLDLSGSADDGNLIAIKAYDEGDYRFILKGESSAKPETITKFPALDFGSTWEGKLHIGKSPAYVAETVKTTDYPYYQLMFRNLNDNEFERYLNRYNLQAPNCMELKAGAVLVKRPILSTKPTPESRVDR